MGFLDLFRRKKATAERSIHVAALPHGRRKGTGAVLQAYRDVSWLRACVDVIANGVATGTKWHAYKPVGATRTIVDKALRPTMPIAERWKALAGLVEKKDLVELPHHEVLALLRNPNPEYGGSEFLRLLTVYMLLPGEAFIHLLRRENGTVGGLALIPPSAVDSTPTIDAPFYRVTMNLVTQHIPAEDVLHMKHLDPLDPTGRGSGLGLSLADEIDTIEAISNTIRNVFKRGGVPAGVVSVERQVGEEDDAQDAADDLQKRFETGFTGPNNAGKMAFVGGHVHIARLTSNLTDDQTVAVLDKTEDRIRECLGVPKELLGAAESGDRDKAESAKYTLADQVLLPRIEFLRDFLQQKLVPFIDPALILEIEDPRPSVQDRVIEAMTAQLNPGFEYNELRRTVGFEPKADLEGVRPPLQPGQSLVSPGAAPAVVAQPAAKDKPKSPTEAATQPPAAA